MNTIPLYDSIGIGYNATRRADPYLTGRLYALLLPQPDSLYADIGCGTGNYTIALAETGLNFCGIEPSKKMLETARSLTNKVKWLAGSAESIPTPDEHFDGAIATLTIHHWRDLDAAFDEIHRVLKPSGRLVIFTATPEQMRGYWLNHYFPEMLEDSMLQMPSFEAVSHAAVKAGFEVVKTEKYFIKADLSDHFLYVGKNRPELYLDGRIRKGISSFSALSNSAEVKKGLLQLAEDISSNQFDTVRRKYENDRGDYLFIVMRKC